MRISTSLVTAGFIASVFMMSTANAKSACRANFEKNVRSIAGLANRLSDPCWAQVQKGRANMTKIMSACTRPGELIIASSMGEYKDANKDLCHNPDCQAELRAQLKVCVDKRPLQYYITKLGL